MSITYERSYKASDGKCYSTMEEAQVVEITSILRENAGDPYVDACPFFAKLVVQDKQKILDVLTLTETSRPRARKVNGGTKKRKTPAAAPEQAQLADVT